MKEKIFNKNILFITTKNLDYIRNTQEIRFLEKHGRKVKIIGSKSKYYLIRLLKVYYETLISKLQNVDVVFIGFAPQLVLPIFAWKFKSKYIVIDFFISMYDTLVYDRRKFPSNSCMAHKLHELDKKTLDAADSVIVDTREHGKYFMDEFQCNPIKVQVLYLEADKKIYFPQKSRKPPEYCNKFLIHYFGSILPLQGVEIVIGAAIKLQHIKAIHFEIIGPINTKIQTVALDTITYIDWLPQEKLAEHISWADLCLAGHFAENINKAKRTIPGKAFIYEAMGKTMILGDNNANRELYHEDENHYFVEMGNADMLAKKILTIYKKVNTS